MTAKLMIREVGQREFVQHNGDFTITQANDEPRPSSGVQEAINEGERLCAEGNVEAFQVWSLVTTRQRVWKFEEVTA